MKQEYGFTALTLKEQSPASRRNHRVLIEATRRRRPTNQKPSRAQQIMRISIRADCQRVRLRTQGAA